MTLVATNTCDILMLKFIVNKIATDGGAPPSGGNRILRLYKNNLTPGDNTVLANITEETLGSYTPITLIGTNWTEDSTGGVNSVYYSRQTFAFTTNVTIYGYYVTTNEMSPQLLWIERFTNGPYMLPSGGGNIAVDPKLICD